jgi:catechol 2,3-dioxygenase-like lactoylglutathione lyase family enzyme
MGSVDEQMVVAHFIVSDDVERSRRFYTEVLGGRTVISGESGDEVTYVALANTWVIINVGGGPTDDKPTVTLERPPDPDRVSSFLNIRVAEKNGLGRLGFWSANRDRKCPKPGGTARDDCSGVAQKPGAFAKTFAAAR